MYSSYLKLISVGFLYSRKSVLRLSVYFEAYQFSIGKVSHQNEEIWD